MIDKALEVWKKIRNFFSESDKIVSAFQKSKEQPKEKKEKQKK